MSTSLVQQISTAIHENERIPEECIAYFEQRTLDEFYDFVMSEFRASKESTGLTKATLAKRIGRGPEQVNRLLAYPGNWTIHTVVRLLLGIAGKEAILNSSSIFNRPPSNMRMEDVLDDDAIQKIDLRDKLPIYPGTSNLVSVTSLNPRS